MAWGDGRQPVIALLIPVLAAQLISKRIIFALVVGYMAAATRSLAVGAWVFTPEPLGVAVGMAGWVGFVFLVATLWVLTALGSSRWTRVVTIMAMQAVLLVPPAWLLGIAHPVLGIGFLLGGAGWIGLAVGLAAPSIVGVMLRGSPQRVPYVAILALVLAGLSWNGADADLRFGPGTFGVVSRAGPPTAPDMDAAARLPKLADAIRAANEGAEGADRLKLIAFPEAVIGVANESLPLLVRIELQPVVDKEKVSAFVGVDRLLLGRRQVSALLVTPGQPPQWIDARQPMPVTLWRPWESDGFEADWSRSSLAVVPGVGRVWISFCFEDVVPGFALSAIWRHRPDMLISMANNWWSTEAGSQAQARSIESIARLFRIPLVRSVNLRS